MTLLRPRWIAGHLLVLFLTAGFVALGIWQLARDHHKQQLVKTARAEYAAPAPDLAIRAVPSGSRGQATGRYDPAHEVLLRNRVRDGKDGDDVLTPLLLADGRAVLVDRGWVAQARAASGAAPATTDPVVVRGVVRAPSPLGAHDTVTTAGGRLSVPRVDLTRIGRDLPYRLLPFWVEAQSQTPVPAPDAPALPQPPPPDQVNHLQYAIEWFAFAAIGLLGWPIALFSISRRRGGFSTPDD